MVGVPEGPGDAPLDEHCVGLGACSLPRKWNGSGAPALSDQGNAYVVSDVTVWEQRELVACCPFYSYTLVVT